ncbi:MAG: dipeptide epimerase [Bacteroidales bacterium]|nr:dipeptide epimerase [Bacteroidales bacterium]
MDRRHFLKTSAAAAAAAAVSPILASCGQSVKGTKSASRSGVLQLSYKPYVVELAHTFTISGFSRDTTTVLLTEITYDGVTGYGEAALPPYMAGQTLETASRFLDKIDLSQFSNPFELDEILTYVDGIEEGMSCPKCGVDIALNDLVGKLLGHPLHEIWGFTASRTPDTSFTIGMDTPEVIAQKTREAAPYKILKVKLGSTEKDDKMIIDTVRSVTDKPIVVDANQGWKDKHYALEMIHWLNERGIRFVEQPMPRTVIDEMAWVTERSPLPTFADESCQRLTDVKRLWGAFSGINIKLLKCTGLREAKQMIETARGLGMGVMIGCTTETSCAISAMAQLAPKVDFADLDGNLLITNDCFSGMKIVNGKITLNNDPGIGVTKLL